MILRLCIWFYLEFFNWSFKLRMKAFVKKNDQILSLSIQTFFNCCIIACSTDKLGRFTWRRWIVNWTSSNDDPWIRNDGRERWKKREDTTRAGSTKVKSQLVESIFSQIPYCYLSIGLEHSDDLKADMKRALDNIWILPASSDDAKTRLKWTCREISYCRFRMSGTRNSLQLRNFYEIFATNF